MTEIHGPLPVHGYKAQDSQSIMRVNNNKILEEQVLIILDEMSAFPSDFDPRWTSIARTYLELGFMAMNRAVFKPDRVKLP
jgi:hypothetical protein